MSESIIKNKELSHVYEEIRHVYLNDNRPWIIGFSGGKDSTCLVQIVWEALSKLPKEKLTKKIYVISSDTLVEAPQIAQRITNSLDLMEKFAKKESLPISTNLLRPPIANTFWVRLLGLGYPAPTSMFRWCTDMLKISNADRFITNTVSKHGEVIVLLGMRKSESTSREQRMNLLKIEDTVLSRHSQYAQTYVYTPLEDFTAEDVWNYLMQIDNPWGDNNNDLLAMYQDANARECPLVIDTTTPSCGGGRFGCWTCTVVDDQGYLTNLIESSEDYKWMSKLRELREILKETQDEYSYYCKKCELFLGHELTEAERKLNKESFFGICVSCNEKLVEYSINQENVITDENRDGYFCKKCDEYLGTEITEFEKKTTKKEDIRVCSSCKNKQNEINQILEFRFIDENVKRDDLWVKFRQKVRRDGQVSLKMGESEGYTPGPYRMNFRKNYLERLLQAQKEIQENSETNHVELILDEEIHEIQRIWRMEEGDWKNSAYEIYKKVTGKQLDFIQEDIGGFSKIEQETLEEICNTKKVPFKLISTLLNMELKLQGSTRHAKIFDKLKSELEKEWRDVEDDQVFQRILEQKEYLKDIEERTKPKSGDKNDN